MAHEFAGDFDTVIAELLFNHGGGAGAFELRKSYQLPCNSLLRSHINPGGTPGIWQHDQ